MSDSIDRQFEEADAAVTQAVTRFASEIESMFGKWEAVAPPYIIAEHAAGTVHKSVQAGR